MQRKLIAALSALALAGAGAVALATQAGGAPTGPGSSGGSAACAPTTYSYGFEGGDWQGWVPEDGGNTRGWWIDPSTAAAHGGSSSLNYQLDGTWDNGTIWVERQFTGPVSTSVPVTVTYWQYTPAAAAASSTAVGAWLTTAGIAAGDFDLGMGHAPFEGSPTWQNTNEPYSPDRWKQYTVTRAVDTTATSGAINVAVAIHANFEAKRTTYHIDDVAVTIC